MSIINIGKEILLGLLVLTGIVGAIGCIIIVTTLTINVIKDFQCSYNNKEE